MKGTTTIAVVARAAKRHIPQVHLDIKLGCLDFEMAEWQSKKRTEVGKVIVKNDKLTDYINKWSKKVKKVKE